MYLYTHVKANKDYNVYRNIVTHDFHSILGPCVLYIYIHNYIYICVDVELSWSKIFHGFKMLMYLDVLWSFIVFVCGWYDFYWVKILKIRPAGQLVAIFLGAWKRMEPPPPRTVHLARENQHLPKCIVMYTVYPKNLTRKSPQLLFGGVHPSKSFWNGRTSLVYQL